MVQLTLAIPERDATHAGGRGTAPSGQGPFAGCLWHGGPCIPGAWCHSGLGPAGMELPAWAHSLLVTFAFREGNIQRLCQSISKQSWPKHCSGRVVSFWSSLKCFTIVFPILLMFSDRKKVGMYYLGSTEICNLGLYVHIMF